MLRLTAKPQYIACLSTAQVNRVQLSFGFYITMGFGNVKSHLFLKFCMYFCFFLYSHSRTKRAQLVSQLKWLKMPQYFTTVKLYILLKYGKIRSVWCQINNITWRFLRCESSCITEWKKRQKESAASKHWLHVCGVKFLCFCCIYDEYNPEFCKLVTLDSSIRNY
jgi:hypothetical protein